MKKKEIGILMVFMCIELVSYVYYQPDNSELFFFVWAIIFLVFVLYRWPGYGFNLFGIGKSDHGRYQHLMMARENNQPRKNIISYGKMYGFDIATILLFVCNLVISIISY